MAALSVFVECVTRGGAEGGEEIAAEDAGLESSSGEESYDAVKIVEECVLVAVLDREVEDVLTSGVPEGEELLIPFYAGGGGWWNSHCHS